ncbi:hypothetical protein [Nonomuraea dietziae]|uniref:hypothetical protein n=1 Tax=Nonomuraea dietziae TaxID=65515 RepID=UPI00341265FE
MQIDHTPVDLEVVHERHRLPIGRPNVTATIDVASRCVVGLVVTLERLGVEATWPMSGGYAITTRLSDTHSTCSRLKSGAR